MILDKDQKATFCRWLETQIQSSKGIVEQMKKLPMPINALVEREQAEQAACMIVLRMIQSGEEMTIR